MVVRPSFGPAYNPHSVRFGTATRSVIHAVERPFRESTGFRHVVTGWGACGHVWRGTDDTYLRALLFYPQACSICLFWRDV